MLAAESAWRVLLVEHRRLRELSAAIERTVELPSWHLDAQQVALLRALIEGMQSFNDGTHRPKGVVLLEVLRARAELNQFLDSLAEDQSRCDTLLGEALASIDGIERGEPGAVDRCSVLLSEHHRLLTSHLDREDTVLRLHTNEALTEDEWSAVVSSISAVIAGGPVPPS